MTQRPLPFATLSLLALLAALALWALELIGHGYSTNSIHLNLTAMNPASFWHLIDLGGHFLYFVPLYVTASTLNCGIKRRLLLGFVTLAIVAALLWILATKVPSARVLHCFHLVNALFLGCIAWRMGSIRWRWALATGYLSVAVSAVMSSHHGRSDFLISMLAGIFLYRVASSAKLSFLDEPRPWHRIRHHILNFVNLVFRNDALRWTLAYEQGMWDFLQSANQKPRHYLLAGIIKDRLPGRPRILDVGCGYGDLLESLEPCIDYTGIDLAEPAIRHCQQRFQNRKRTQFATVSFEQLTDAGGFDAVVLNEVLYYFPANEFHATLTRAQSLLRNDHSILLISMNGNLKATRLWKQLSDITKEKAFVRVQNLRTGSAWTIGIYTRAELTLNHGSKK